LPPTSGNRFIPVQSGYSLNPRVYSNRHPAAWCL